MVCLLEQGVDTATCLGTALKGSRRVGTAEKVHQLEIIKQKE